MAAYQTNPLFYAGSDQILSATDLNRIRENVRLIDGWTYRTTPAFDSSAGVDTGTPGYTRTEDLVRIWWGGIRMVAGCTTLTVEGYGAKTGSEVVAVYVGGDDTTGSGTKLGTITLPAVAGAFSGSWSIAGLGWNDGDVKQIELRIEGAHTNTASYQVTDCYLSPVAKAGWVAAPAFASVADATDAAALTALGTAIDWVYARMRLVPLPARLGLYYNLGPFKLGDPQHVNRPMYYGSVGRYHSSAELRVRLWVNSLTTAGWNLAIQLNGATAYTSPTYGVGNQLVDVRLPLTSYTLGSRVRVAILASCTDQGTTNPLRFTRWSNGIMHAVAPSSGWPYASLSTAFVGPSAPTNAGALRAALASLASIVNAAKARIDARPEQWARSRAVRRYYTRNAASEELLMQRARMSFVQRSGSELFVAGKNVEIAYGPVTTHPDEQANGWEKYQYERHEGVDATSGTTVYLDNLDGLDYGMAYAILGDPVYAAEYVG